METRQDYHGFNYIFVLTDNAHLELMKKFIKISVKTD